MIPQSHVLFLGLLELTIGLIGLLLRRDAITVLISALVALNSGLLLLCAGPGGATTGLQAAGVALLATLAALASIGAAVVYALHRFQRPVSLDEHDRMRH